MLFIHGLGHFHPENVISNQFLEDLDIGTNDEWIRDRVGIQTRRSVLPLDYIRQTKNRDPRGAVEASQFTNAETGRRAAMLAIKRAGIEPTQIGMVIAGGCSPDHITPAEACTVAAALGIEAISFDLNSACSSFGAQLYFLSLMQPQALPEFILLVSPENNTRTIDYSDRRNAVLWGDGSSAAVVSTRVTSRARVQCHAITSDPQGWDKVYIPRLGHFDQDGPNVQAFAVKRTVSSLREIQEKYVGNPSDLFFVGHQANLRMLESVCRRCEISPDRHFSNVSDFGNTGAAGAPSALSQNWQKFRDGDRVAVVVVGAGLTWASLVIEFGTSQNGKTHL